MRNPHLAIDELIAALHRVPLFSDLSNAELRLIAERATVRRYDPGQVIFSEGDPCSELLVVKEGSVKVLKTAANGRRQLLSMERIGNSLSELSIFDGNPYPATAEATAPTTLLCLAADHFRRVCQQHPGVALKVIKVLGHRLRRMGSLIEELSFSTVRTRLVAYLIHLAEEGGHRCEAGIQVALSENNEELAARLGTVRELVSRNLGRLHNEGLLDVRRRVVIIPNLTA